jgi:GT2 family glycosyltransferase
MAMQPQTSLTLSIIIVSYNTASLTLKAVNSVIKDIKNSPSLKNLVEIFVIDNNSQDETLAQLEKLQKTNQFLKIIKNKKNLGFAKANNQAISKSQGKYIFLLNSDAQVLPGALNQLVKTFETNPIDNSTAQLTSHKGKLDRLGILAATLLNPDQTYQPQGGTLPTLFSLATTLFLLDDIPIIGQLLPAVQETGRSPKAFLSNSQLPQQKGWVGGTAMCIRREVINEIGLLDENIFMYGEDMEYCLRAKNHHWDIAIDPLAKVIHVGSASSTDKTVNSTSENAILGEIKTFLYIWTKHKPHWQMYFVKMILYFAIKFRIVVFGTIFKDNDRKRIYKKAKELIYAQ